LMLAGICPDSEPAMNARSRAALIAASSCSTCVDTA